MPVFDILNQTKTKIHPRTQMMSAIFDCPIEDVNKFELTANIPIDGDDSWNIGAIIGPSGCGKSSILSHFGKERDLKWDDASIITSFDSDIGIKEIAEALNSVGFSNIRAWMRPYGVLSNGEKFRSLCARIICEAKNMEVLDEFTSVVDRQTAKIACHAVQKTVRKNSKKIIIASCHDDIIDWLQPDWYYLPHKNEFNRRLLRRRPKLGIEIYRVKYDCWKMFAPFHYLTASLNKAAVCYCLFVNGKPASFAGLLNRPISAKGDHKKIQGVSRLVTLPDYQGLGLAFVLVDFLGSYYKKQSVRVHTYPAHPILVKNFANNKKWLCIKSYGITGARSSNNRAQTKDVHIYGGRQNAVFRYIGD